MKITNKKAISVIEYSILLIIIIGAFYAMKSHIQRGIFSPWAKAGQGLAYGRQFDSQKTIECGFDDQSGRWYDRNCYQYYINNNACNGNEVCQEGIILGGSCSTSACNQLNNGGSS